MAAAELTKKIYSLAAVCGVLKSSSHDDGLHDIVYRETGKTSVRELTEAEAKRVIAELQGYLRVSTLEPPPAKATAQTNRFGSLFGLFIGSRSWTELPRPLRRANVFRAQFLRLRG